MLWVPLLHWRCWQLSSVSVVVTLINASAAVPLPAAGLPRAGVNGGDRFIRRRGRRRDAVRRVMSAVTAVSDDGKVGTPARAHTHTDRALPACLRPRSMLRALTALVVL
jgi:hypothetical protein